MRTFDVPYTKADDDMILKLRHEGNTHLAISKVLGRTRASVVSRYRKIIMENHDTDDINTTDRKCLRCGKMFGSSHIGNRLCHSCHNYAAGASYAFT